MFITFEAIDGAGKTIQARLLAERLASEGFDVDLTREPGGTEGAEAIRALLLSGEADKWSAMTELLLFTAARRDHVERRIRPALESGKIVICDRFIDTTRVYQTYANPENRQTVDLLHSETIGLMPDLTIILDIDPFEGLTRSLARNDQMTVDESRFERNGLDFQRSNRAGFLAVAADEPTRCRVINATGTIEEVAERIYLAVQVVMSNSPEPAL